MVSNRGEYFIDRSSNVGSGLYSTAGYYGYEQNVLCQRRLLSSLLWLPLLKQFMGLLIGSLISGGLYLRVSLLFEKHILRPTHQALYDIMLLMTLLVVTVSVVCTLATPLNITSMQPLVLNKRAAPSVKKNDYTEQQIQQIKEGHLDAIKLASMVVSQSSNPDTFDPIFQNYFQLSDREAVIGRWCSKLHPIRR